MTLLDTYNKIQSQILWYHYWLVPCACLTPWDSLGIGNSHHVTKAYIDGVPVSRSNYTCWCTSNSDNRFFQISYKYWQSLPIMVWNKFLTFLTSSISWLLTATCHMSLAKLGRLHQSMRQHLLFYLEAYTDLILDEQLNFWSTLYILKYNFFILQSCGEIKANRDKYWHTLQLPERATGQR